MPTRSASVGRLGGGPASRGRTTRPAADGWRSSAAAARRPASARAVIVRSASRNRSSMSGIAAATSAAPNQRSGGSSGVRHGPRILGRWPSRSAGCRYDPIVPTIDLKQSAANLKLERDAIVLYDAFSRIERDPLRAQAFRTIAEQRAPPRRHLGREAPQPRGATAAGDRAAAAGPVHRARGPVLRHPRRSGPRPGARGRRRGAVHRPVEPGRKPRSRIETLASASGTKEPLT